MNCVTASLLIKQEYTPQTYLVISDVHMQMKTYNPSYISIIKFIDRPLG